MDINELLSKTKYQTFEDLMDDTRYSYSKQKLDLMNISPKGKTILDIWCNAGYLPIRYKQQWAKYVIAIDRDLELITLANWYKEYYWLEDIEFHHQDIFDNFKSKKKFDIITCLSAFHYFNERQPEFFEICHKLLKKGWTLIREWGIAQDDLVKYARWPREDHNPPRFRSDKAMREIAKGFDCIRVGKSVDQPGDNIPRYVYHFQKQ